MTPGAVVLPGAVYRQLPGKSTTPLDPRWITVHTMAGTLAGTESWFTPAGRAYSHHGLGGDGETRQWQDLRYRAASDLDGNPYSISWECEDTGPGFPKWTGSNVPAFTDDQADALIVGLSWECYYFRLPKVAIRSSCPHERGIGYHRLGIDPWRRSGCLHFSKSAGKACPGDRRIAQLTNEIIPQVSAPVTPAPEILEDDDMVIIRYSNSAAAIASGKMVRITGEVVAANAAKAGVPVFYVERDEWERFAKAYGGIVEG